MRSKYTSTLAILVCFFFIQSCSSDDEDDFPLVGTNISMDEIAGTWNATRASFSLAADGPAVELEVVAAGGTVTLVIQANGRFTLTIVLPARSPEVSTGQLGFDEDLLVVSYDEDPEDYELFGIQATETTLSISGPSEFDFDGDGTDEAAIVELDMERN